MKKLLFFAVLIYLSCLAFADSYRITDVEYTTKGRTRPYAIDIKVPVDTDTVFQSEDELMEYITDYVKQLDNTRTFEKISSDFSLKQHGSEQAENLTDGETAESAQETDILYDVTLFISTEDSKHMLVVPYPKYDSNGGFTLRLKAKDTNFLGLMESASGDFNFAVEQDDENDEPDFTFGFNMDFKIPFKVWKLDAAWTNDMSISYTIGESTPEWNLKTGLDLELPFDIFSVKLSLNQSFIRNLDYEDYDENGVMVHYGDGTYFVEDAKLSVPIILQKVRNWGNIYYTPYISGTYNWDFDGISDLYPVYKSDDGLLGPSMTIGHTISTERINWIENFRNGISASFTESASYNFKTYTFSPGITAELKAFKAFRHFGLSTDIYTFAYLNSNLSIGGRLRGIRDEQYFDSSTGDSDKKACYTPGAIVINIDIPIKIFRVHWENVPGIKRIPFVRYFDMEFQLNPFIDFALMKNRSTGTTFDFRDGFLSGGIEAIVYPLKWKGIQVRASFGVDLSRKMPFIKNKLNQEWRDSVSPYELSIGIGLHY